MEDPSDFSALEADIAAAVERLKDDLSKLRAGGRFNPEVLENLRVAPDKTAATKKVKLSDLAQVVPKGRTVQVMVGEKDVSCNALPLEGMRAYATGSKPPSRDAQLTLLHSTSNPFPPPSSPPTSLLRPSLIPQAPTHYSS